MTLCKYCNKPVPDNSKFCGNCGNPISNETDQLFDKALSLANQSDASCVPLLLECAKSGNCNAYIALGQIYDAGDFVQEDAKLALFYYNKSVELGSKLALGAIGSLYFSGRLGDENRYKAFEYLKEHLTYYPEDEISLFDLGRCFADGIGTDVNYEKAKTYFLIVLELNPQNISYIWRYATSLKEMGSPECISWFEKGSQLGDAASSYYLGCIYSEGSIVKQDFQKTKLYLKKVTEQATDQESELRILAINKLNLVEAEEKNYYNNLNKATADIDGFTLKAIEIAETGAYDSALDMFKNAFNNNHNNYIANFFIIVLNGMNTNLDNAKEPINSLSTFLRSGFDAMLSQAQSNSSKLMILDEIAVFSSRLSLHIYELYDNKFEEMINQKNLMYNRLSPLGFMNNYMVPICEKMANLQYFIGDKIDSIFPDGKAIDSSKKAWSTGNLYMSIVAEHGNLFEKISRKNTLKLYKKKAK